MNKKKRNGAFVWALIAIIFCFIVITVMYATGFISFGSKSNHNDKKQTSNNFVDNKSINNSSNDNSSNDKKNTEQNNSTYNSIIEEYKNAMNDKGYLDNDNNEDKYPNINNNMMHSYHNYLKGNFDGTMIFYYTYYDINKDGKNELIVSSEDYDIIDEIYAYDGSKVVRFFNQSCLGERCSAQIYDNGIIYFYGASGASIHGLSFYEIDKDGYSKKTIASYTVEYDENQNITITDDNTNSKTNFSSDEQVIDSVKKNANKLDLDSLNWNEIK